MTYQETLTLIESTQESLTLEYAKRNSIQTKENSSLAEKLVTLLGIPAIEVFIGDDSTEVKLCYGQYTKGESYWRTADLTIRHRRDYDFEKSTYKKARTFELSWFSSSANLDSSPYYFDYLKLLGIVADEIKNGSLQKSILSSCEKIKVNSKTISELETKIRNEKESLESLVVNARNFDTQQALYRAIGNRDGLNLTNSNEYEDRANNRYNKDENRLYSTRECQLTRKKSFTFDMIEILEETKKGYKVRFNQVWWKTETKKDGTSKTDKDGNNIMTKETHWSSVERISKHHLENIIRQNWTKSLTEYKNEAATLAA